MAQTRAACANEVRKRDRQIESLKKAVTEAGRARGAGKGTGITTITVVGDIGSDADQLVPGGQAGSDGYDLRTETNAFLAELAKGLSEENETLLQLVRRTTSQLKEMSGWDASNGIETEHGDGHALVLAANPTDMSAEIDAVLEHLRTILTNPSFVPIEEVVVREDEIHRLRDGWEKMETRWKEAVHLIDGWRKRMQASGRPVNVEELKMGLRLSPVKVNNVEETSHGFGLCLEAVPEDAEDVDLMPTPYDDSPLNLVPEAGADDDEDSDASSEFEHDVDVDDLDAEEPNVEILQQSVMLSSPPLPPPPQLSPLKDSYAAGNRGERSSRRTHQRNFNPIAEENTWEVQPEEAPLPPPPVPPHAKTQQPPQKKPILSLRTVPPEEAAAVSLPASAVVSTPDTSVDSIPLNKRADKAASKPTSAPTRTQKRPPMTTRRSQQREETKPPSKPPVKAARPVKPAPPRGRSQTRKDERESQKSKPPPRATSASSSKSAAASKNGAASKSASSAQSMPPPPSPAKREPAPTPGQSPKRVNSRLPLPRNGCTGVLPAPQQSPLTMETIAAKLAASERDADAARVRAKLKAARLNKGAVNLPPPTTTSSSTSSLSRTAAPAEADLDADSGTMSTRSESDSAHTHNPTGSSHGGDPTSCSSLGSSAPPKDARDEETPDEFGFSVPPPPPPAQQQQKRQSRRQQEQPTDQQQQQQQKARKRERRTSNKVASRRRSTLNPWELDALIQGGTVTVER